jgi:hypothetical protein
MAVGGRGGARQCAHLPRQDQACVARARDRVNRKVASPAVERGSIRQGTATSGGGRHAARGVARHYVHIGSNEIWPRTHAFVGTADGPHVRGGRQQWARRGGTRRWSACWWTMCLYKRL